jgi:dihydroorotase
MASPKHVQPALTTLIRAGRLIDTAEGVDDPRDILLERGRVAAIEPLDTIDADRAERVINARDLITSPGFADIHVHLREPGGEASETVATGCRAAAVGGFTRVWCMPNTNPVNDSPVVTTFILDRARAAAGDLAHTDRAAGPREIGAPRVHPVAAITKDLAGERLVDFGALLAAGAVAFTDDGRPVADAGVMRRAMLCAADLGVVLMQHCEDHAITGPGVMHAGPAAAALGLAGIPRTSEASIVARDGLLALETGARLHVQHVSNALSAEAIRHLKHRGSPVTAEVSPHHLLLTDERVRPRPGAPAGLHADTHAKMKPPLCEESDRRALIEALEDGTIDCIATDHAPHAPTLKAAPFEDAPFGIIGMEAAFPALYTAFVDPNSPSPDAGRWDLEFLIDKLTAAPGRVMAHDEIGTLREGAPADITFIETGCRYDFDARHLGSRSRNCPWIGDAFTARIAATLVAGRIAHVHAEGPLAGAF